MLGLLGAVMKERNQSQCLNVPHINKTDNRSMNCNPTDTLPIQTYPYYAYFLLWLKHI